jgi:hypothetical protein
MKHPRSLTATTKFLPIYHHAASAFWNVGIMIRDCEQTCKGHRARGNIEKTSENNNRSIVHRQAAGARLGVLDLLLLRVGVLGAGEGVVRDPLGGRARGALLEHAVDLLEREALGLGDHEVREQQAERAAATPGEKNRLASRREGA